MPRFRIHYFNKSSGQDRSLVYDGKDGDDCRNFMKVRYPHCIVNKIKLLRDESNVRMVTGEGRARA